MDLSIISEWIIVVGDLWGIDKADGDYLTEYNCIYALQLDCHDETKERMK